MQIAANEEQIKKSLLDLNIPTLLMVMTQYTGDDRWLVDRYRPKPIYVPEGEIFPDDRSFITSEIVLIWSSVSTKGNLAQNSE